MSLTIEQYHERFDQRRIDELLNSLDAQPARAVKTRLSELSFQLAKALTERDELQQKLDDLSTPHSFRPDCTNPVCVMRRERDEARACLREAINLRKQALYDQWRPMVSQEELLDVPACDKYVVAWRKAAGIDGKKGEQ